MIVIDASAETFDEVKRKWNINQRTYNYRAAPTKLNRKRAITWALDKVEKEFPNHRDYRAEIIRAYPG